MENTQSTKHSLAAASSAGQTAGDVTRSDREPRGGNGGMEPHASAATGPSGSPTAIHHATTVLEEPAEVAPTDLPRIGTAGVAVIALLIAALLGGLFLLGYLPHRKLSSEIRNEAAEMKDARPVVNVAVPRRQAQSTRLVLPADIRAFQQTLIYPRANGYLKKLEVDIGDHVQAGQLLAEIDTPELDAQLNQARAAVQQAQASLDKARSDLALAETTLQRYQDVGSGGVAKQQLDEKAAQLEQSKASLEVARANLEASRAEVQRLEALQGFQKVVAPFAGVISCRNYDVGALLSSTTAGSGKELFQIDRTDTLRVFVNVPQTYATAVQAGQKAELLVRNYPGRSFDGEVTRSAGSIDPTTRTLRVEIDVENREGLLFAGMYGQVRFEVTQEKPPLLIPTSALVFNADGLSVAVVKDGSVRFQKVSTGRDLGTEIEILEGLAGNEQVVANPSEQIREGTGVQTVSSRANGRKESAGKD